MYIHIGGEKVIRAVELIAIFDMNMEQASKLSKEFVEQAAIAKKVETIGEEESKSIVVTDDWVYYSPISSATLKKRANQLLTGDTVALNL